MGFLKSVFWPAVVLIATTHVASAQRCPPNSRPEAVAIPGNLSTAQCFCNPGFTPVNGRCVRVPSGADGRSPDDPGRVLVAPMPSR